MVSPKLSYVDACQLWMWILVSSIHNDSDKKKHMHTTKKKVKYFDYPTSTHMSLAHRANIEWQLLKQISILASVCDQLWA